MNEILRIFIFWKCFYDVNIVKLTMLLKNTELCIFVVVYMSSYENQKIEENNGEHISIYLFRIDKLCDMS